MPKLLYNTAIYLFSLSLVSSVVASFFWWWNNYSPEWWTYFILVAVFLSFTDIVIHVSSWAYKLLCTSWATGK